MYNLEGNRLTFTWPEGTGIVENLAELLEGIRFAGEISIAIQDTVRLVIPNYDQTGSVEGRNTRSQKFPTRTTGIVLGQEIGSDPYITLMYETQSIYYHISIPGLCQLADANILCINPEFAPWKNAIFNAVFNSTSCTIVPFPCPSHYAIYTNMPRTHAFLTKRPRIPKSVDFTPIFVALFGEKIANVIMKEIK